VQQGVLLLLSAAVGGHHATTSRQHALAGRLSCCCCGACLQWCPCIAGWAHCQLGQRAACGQCRGGGSVSSSFACSVLLSGVLGCPLQHTLLHPHSRAASVCAAASFQSRCCCCCCCRSAWSCGRATCRAAAAICAPAVPAPHPRGGGGGAVHGVRSGALVGELCWWGPGASVLAGLRAAACTRLPACVNDARKWRFLAPVPWTCCFWLECEQPVLAAGFLCAACMLPRSGF
jgi:hypothetical protein